MSDEGRVMKEFWAVDRDSTLPFLYRYETIRNNWDYSRSTILKISNSLYKSLSEFPVDAVAVAGSYGRMEASELSDLDCIIFINKKSVQENNGMEEAIINTIRSILIENGIEEPNKYGAFMQTCSLGEILKNLGDEEEDLGNLTRRILMLMESKPLYNENRFIEIVDSILDKYVDHVKSEKHKQFAFLINDLIRYFRSICVNYQSRFWKDGEKWPIRNIKLRHSRILIYSSLLFALGEAGSADPEEKIDMLRRYISMTPLERLYDIYQRNGDDGFVRLLGLYENFLRNISNKETRDKLMGIDYENRYNEPLFVQLKTNSDAFISELSRFLYSRKGWWSDRFFEYIVF